MSAAASTVDDASVAAPPKKGKKKFLIIALAALLLLTLAGGGTVMFLKKRAANAAAQNGTEQVQGHGAAKPNLAHPPTFLPLDPFVVNLSDRDADRYAQIGITMEVQDAKFADQMKAFMPAIRNTVLLILSQKSSRELLDRAGKEQLATEIQRESARTMGIDLDPAATAQHAGGTPDEPGDEAAPKAVTRPTEPNPIRRVHFSNFIVQ